MTNRNCFQGGFSNRFRLLFLAGGLLALTANVHGQEALRISMAGDLAASAQQQADNSLGYYNLLTGPVAWQFSSAFGTEFNDNVRLQQNGESDLILRPSLDTSIHWPVTLKNSLDAVLQVGYSEYLQHQDLSQFFINPGSGLSFDIYAGHFKINLHDRIAITEYAYQNAGASGGNQNLESLQNTLGANALWDFGKGIANLGYDHVNYLSLSQNQGEPDAASENVTANAGIRVRPELLMGLEAGGTVINYSQSGSTNFLITPSAVQWSAGVFGSAKISDYIDVRMDVGYMDYIPDNSTTNVVTSDSSGFYLSVSLSHRVNRWLNYTLTAGRSTDLSAYGQAQSYYFVRLNPNLNLFRKYSISTPIWWQDGTRVYNYQGSGAADYDQFGFGLNVSRSLTKKLSASLGYQFIDETSNQSDLNYTVNIVDLNFTYKF